MSPNGRLLAIGLSNGVSLFDLPTGLEVAHVASGWALYVRFDPQDGSLLTYGDRGLFRWPVSVAAGSPETIAVGPARRIGEKSTGHVEFDISKDGKVLLASLRSHAVILRRGQDGSWSKPPARPPPWGDTNVRDWLELVRPNDSVLRPLTDVRVVRISPDGRWAVTVTHGSSEGVIWDTRTGRPVANVGGLRAFLFTPDGRWLTDGCKRYAVGTWQEGPPLPVAEGMTALAFTADGSLFAGQVNDEAVHLVDAATGKTLVQLGLPEQSRSNYAAFSADGTRLVLQSADYHYVYAWDLRALRQHLAGLDLDWESPSFAPAPADEERLPPICKQLDK